MSQLFSGVIGDVFTQIDRDMKERKRNGGWTVVRSDDKTIHFTFGAQSFELKDEVCQTIKYYDLDQFNLWVDTYESTFDVSMEIG